MNKDKEIRMEESSRGSRATSNQALLSYARGVGAHSFWKGGATEGEYHFLS